ncbi:hypothetical protein, partial [Pseudomonas syringae]|uniref:hypothetical protein n=1 Tax=Pseudomonas syringae TaxID=317 RepID=UPI001F38B550
APSDGFDGLSGHFFVCCQYKTKRPEQVGAFAWAFISVFSHSLSGYLFCIFLKCAQSYIFGVE